MKPAQPSSDQPKRGRRTAAGGGPAAKSRSRKPGNAGYAGYVYQITVTMWIALDLMLVKNRCDRIHVEPPSDEDIEAAVTRTETGVVETAAKGDRLDLVIQAKTRTGAPWSTTAIADVLLGKDPTEGASAKRSRPLEMLANDAGRNYVFVTNESSAEPLRPHEGEDLFDFPTVDDLPPHVRDGMGQAERAAIASRIVLLTGVTHEVLKGRLTTQLEQHGHVPKPKHERCLDDLFKLVGQRLCGESGGWLTRGEILEVLVRNGGSIAPTRDMDHYVRPFSYESIVERLADDHAVVISGPSGTGKTLTADILELDLRRGDPPFDVVGEEHGPGHVRHHLTRTDPVVFHLRDPWGGNRLVPGSDRWSSELPKLLQHAGPGRKFLITSRSDVIESAGVKIVKALKPYRATIAIEDYGPDLLARIYDGISSDLKGPAKTLSRGHRDAALKALGRPYEIKRFLVALSRETKERPRDVADIIADSQIGAISRVIAEQIAPFGREGVQASAIVWALLVARGAVPRKVFAQLARRLRSADPALRPDLTGLLDFLVAGQNIREDGDALSFHHPKVEDGLRIAFVTQPSEAEFVLERVVSALIAWDGADDDWGRETALAILRRTDAIDTIEIEPPIEARAALDRFLEANAIEADKRFDFEVALGDLARFASADHLPGFMARLLTEGAGKEERSFGSNWRPPVLGSEQAARLSADPRVGSLARRFVREALPFTHVSYPVQFGELLSKVAGDLTDDFWDALETIAGPNGPNENIEAIVAGALLAADAEDFERAIERFARSEDEADAEMERTKDDRRAAEEHALDADGADHELERSEDMYFNAHKGMQVTAALRRRAEGMGFVKDHPRAQLLVVALAREFVSATRTVDAAELRVLLQNAKGWALDHAWDAIGRNWDDSFAPDLEAALIGVDPEMPTLRRRLIEIADRSRVGGDLIAQLAQAAALCTPERRLQLIRDVATSGFPREAGRRGGRGKRRERALQLASSYPAAEREVAEALTDALTKKDGIVGCRPPSVEAQTTIEALLPNVSADVARPLSMLAAAAGLDVTSATSRLLETDDEDDGLAALDALITTSPPDLRARLTTALNHGRFKVRRAALELLVRGPTDAEERARLIRLAAHDESSEVRLAFTRLMADVKWREAIDDLTLLLGDERNYASHSDFGRPWARFAVARAAAHALGRHADLPQRTLNALIDTVEFQQRDPFVACAALLALAAKSDDRVEALLNAAIGAAPLRGTPFHRPLAQAAAWAIFDRVRAGVAFDLEPMVAAAREEEAGIAAPLLVAFGLAGGTSRWTLLDGLVGDPERRTLVRLAAVAVGATDGMTLDGYEVLLARIVNAGGPQALADGERNGLNDWSRSLDVSDGFQRVAAWLASRVFGLEVDGEVGNVRGYDLPDRIPVIGMRSFSPFREETGSDEGW